MLILAIDSATPVAGVALVDENRVVREEFVNYGKTHSETLLPMIDRVLSGCGCAITDISALAVTIGPGSFTGLRIGLAAVKGLSMASHKPVVGVSTLEVIAHNLTGSSALVCPLLDARKQEVYCGFYDVGDIYPRELAEPRACSPEQFAAHAAQIAHQSGKNNIILLGDGCFPYKEYFQQTLREQMLMAPSHMMFPRAAALGSLAVKKVRASLYEDVYTLKPFYIRLSEAESRLARGAL